MGTDLDDHEHRQRRLEVGSNEKTVASHEASWKLDPCHCIDGWPVLFERLHQVRAVCTNGSEVIHQRLSGDLPRVLDAIDYDRERDGRVGREHRFDIREVNGWHGSWAIRPARAELARLIAP